MKRAFAILSALALMTAAAPALQSACTAGLTGRYYNTLNFTGLKNTVISPQIDFAWGGGIPPGSGLPSSNYFSVRWTGCVQAPVTGNVTFWTQSDDGVVLYIGGSTVINNWSTHSATWDSGSLYMVQGQWYTLELDYFNYTGDDTIRLYWSYTGQPLTVVPSSRLCSNIANCPVASSPTPTNVGTPTRTPTASPTPGACNGLAAQFWNATTPSGTPVAVATVGPINNSWTSTSPWSGVNATNMSGLFTGCVNFPNTGTWTLYLNADNSGVLTIGSTSISSSSAEASGTFTVPDASVTYPITISYTGKSSPNSIVLKWSCASPYVAKAVIPAANLCTGSCTAPNYVYQGLSNTALLYDLEYIPFPAAPRFTNGIQEMTVTYSTAAANAVPKNTARFRIVLRNMGSMAQGMVSCETRLGSIGVTCTTGIYSTAGTAPSHPSNLSRTYAWFNNAVIPFTERFDAMGDPRLTPYGDCITGGSSDLADSYNWAFKNIQSGADVDIKAAYKAGLARATYDGGANSVRYDVPRLFKLWREGILQSRSIYNSMTGWSAYYAGVGGEMGGDVNNQLSFGGGEGVQISGYPWGSTSTRYQDDIRNDQDGRDLIRNSNTSWRCLPWMGELWPADKYWDEWYLATTSTATTVHGNLRNTQSGGSWRRDTWANCDANTGYIIPSNMGTRQANSGCAAFMNGGASGSNTFNHWSVTQFDSALNKDGEQTGNQYNMPMPGTFPSQRPWGTNQGANTFTGYDQQPYSSSRTTLMVYTANTSFAATDSGFFAAPSSSTSSRTSAAVRMYQPASDVSNTPAGRVGWVILNGFAYAGESGVNFIARLSLLAALRTFHDAGAPTANNAINGTSYLVVPIPWVTITKPLISDSLIGLQTVHIEWLKKWQRWDSTSDVTVPYSESYPSNYTNSEPVVFNLKYSEDSGKTWYLANGRSATDKGVYVDSDANTMTSFNWYVTGLTKGRKIFRVEAWRPAYSQHYAYHQMNLQIAP